MRSLPLIISIAVLLIFLVRVFPPFRFILLVALTFGLVAFLIYNVMNAVQRRRKALVNRDELEEQMREHMDKCQAQIEQLEKEAEGIRRNISQLERKINPADGLTATTIKDTKNLIAAFNKELRLRESKLSFFRTAARRLSSLLRNHRLQKELAQKQEELEDLRSNNYDDIAEMEELRFTLEREQTYIDTLQDLGRRVEDSEEPADAERLVQELEEMTRQVNRR